uniref:Lens fiber major intrinsic protein-like n=1 Tax=Phallusia mammillata TaxID=59560 RepID=A0A6F9DK71_9ASCI|nr:lens fiber major intrinsic protein-like [Phallusia mammillata]
MGPHPSHVSDHVIDKRPGGMSKHQWALEVMKRQLRDVDLWRSTAAEFLATFIFMFIVCITNMMPTASTTENFAEGRRAEISGNDLQTSVGIALAYATLIQCFEHISGAHMNPAVSVAMVIAGHVTPLKAAMYAAAQMTGSFSAVALCYGMIPANQQQLNAVSQLHSALQPLQGFGIEIMQTVILTVTWLATYATSKSQLGSSALPVGIAYLANCLWAGRLTGSSMNPARSLPPAILSKHWTNLWVYVAGPLTGCVIGAILYTQVFVVAPKTERRRKLTASGRSGEGESVQSDQELTELAPLTRVESHPKPLTSSALRDDRIVVAPTNHFAPSGHTPQPATPRLRQYVQQELHATPQTRPLQRHQTLPSSARRPSVTLQPLHYPPSSGGPMTSVTATRVNSRPATRPSTACGIPLTPRTPIDPISRVSTPQTVFRTLSVPEPFSHSADTLIDNSVL